MTCPQAGFVVVFGRPVSDESCRLSPLPVMILKGRPEPNSINGANVQSLKNARVNPLVPSELVIDHSVQVDEFGTSGAYDANALYFGE